MRSKPKQKDFIVKKKKIQKVQKMRFLIHLITIIYVIIHQIDANSDSNIVLSGGGNGALVMENGKGKNLIKDHLNRMTDLFHLFFKK